jgi:hypothetical protein
MKKLLIPLSFCLLAMSSVSAQEKEVFEKKNDVHNKHQRFTKKLNLSAEQEQQQKAIQQNFKAQIKSLKSNDNITLGEFKKQMKLLQVQRKTAMNSMFTSEQRAALKARKDHKSVAHFEKLKTTLQLTEAQQVLLKKKQNEIQQKVKAIRSNESLSLNSKKEQFEAMKKERKAFLKSILNQEQVQKLESMKKVRK